WLLWAALITLFVLGSGAQNGIAQIVRGSITGRVADSTGAPVPDAKITVTNEQTGIAVHLASGESGTYTVPELNPGTYTVSVEKTGFRQVEVKKIQLLAQQTVRQDITLQVGELQQRVEVSGTAPLINTENQTVSTRVSSVQLEQLPAV